MYKSIYSAHQLHYLPWLAYFKKLASAEQFVFADDVQFKSHNYINRTQIKTARGKLWLTIPVLSKGKSEQLIKDVRINPNVNWQRKHWKTLLVNYKTAPWFEKYADFFDQFYQKEWRFLVDANFAAIEFLLRALDIKTACFLSSDIQLKTGRTERIVHMGKKLRCNTYLSGPSGSKYLDENQFKDNGITVEYFSFNHPEYKQQFGAFIPGMSIVDLLFNEGPNTATTLFTGNQDQQA
ncbi:MAG: hypothetical protein DWQ10_10435 [Calditrichaeota bacterium]|nr:MAG: hypothetical protein DWQ10_10435 [Calditrichota bacterium]